MGTLDNLRHIANQGAEVHLMRWQAICGNAGVAANEIERLRTAMSEALETLKKYEKEPIPASVAGLFIGRFSDELNKST